MNPEKINNVKDLIGKTVTWTSSAQGCEKEKTGKVIDYIAPFQDALTLLPSAANWSNAKFQRVSSVPRFLVEVPRFHKRTGKELSPHYYAPLASQFFD